jgi:hypothetical protein
MFIVSGVIYNRDAANCYSRSFKCFGSVFSCLSDKEESGFYIFYNGSKAVSSYFFR